MIEVVLRTVVAILLAGMAAAYARGWWRLRAAGHAAPRWRPALYALGLVTVAATLLSPLDELAADRFSAHMAQHLLLTMMAAPLLLLGNPLPFVLWGLPPVARSALAAPFRPRATPRAVLSALTFFPVAGLLHVSVVWLWHIPALYDAAVEHEALHAFEHATFFVTAMLFWWPIVQPAPKLRPWLHSGLQILYLLLATAQNTALGMLLVVSERAFYPHYVRAAARLGISAVDDQMFGGGLMWTGGHMYLLPILLILYRLSRDIGHERGDGRRGPQPSLEYGRAERSP
jgi:putative membrane protein